MAARKKKAKITEAQHLHLIAIAKKSAETRVRDAHGHFITGGEHQPEPVLPVVTEVQSMVKNTEETIKEIVQEIVPSTSEQTLHTPQNNFVTFLKIALPAVVLLLAVLAVFQYGRTSIFANEVLATRTGILRVTQTIPPEYHFLDLTGATYTLLLPQGFDLPTYQNRRVTVTGYISVLSMTDKVTKPEDVMLATIEVPVPTPQPPVLLLPKTGKTPPPLTPGS